MTTAQQAARKGLARCQRDQISATLDSLMEARRTLKALIEQEPDGTRDLLLALVQVERAAVVLVGCYAEPVPPAPALAQSQATGKDAAA